MWKSVQVERWGEFGFVSSKDTVVLEEPLEIRLSFGPLDARVSESLGLSMRTPGHDRELALGLLLAEAFIEGVGDVVEVVESEGRVRVDLAPGVMVDLKGSERVLATTSACGVCGRRSIGGPSERSIQPTASRVWFPPEMLGKLPAAMREIQEAFRQTGGLHAAALFDSEGSLVLLREDVGRHNALDKLVGHCLLEDVSTTDKLVLVSGRAGYELVQKAARAGIPMLAAIGAPSSAAVALAEEADLTLVGFLREDRFNAYAGSWRLSAR